MTGNEAPERGRGRNHEGRTHAGREHRGHERAAHVQAGPEGHDHPLRDERRFRTGGRGHAGGHRGHGGPRGRGMGRPGGWQQADVPPADDAAAWLAGRLPADWFVGTPSITVDREEIVVIGELAAPEGTDDATREAAAQGRISRFREESRADRITIAEEAEARYSRKLSWGASIGESAQLFTHLAVPAMTRLRQDERRVLDTLVDAGIARSRSEALAWCVKLVGEHTDEWLANLRSAMSEVDKLRAEGPAL
ncbi:hypothetical protein [Jatrophihabitans sp.]|uniref:hypothetical protein n=1 Tax=Jatrophihabitans sp. TaxID=1932789 RepID=UPI0030C74D7A|nr:hypothetical protein [Jatrophihabitans sp.]